MKNYFENLYNYLLAAAKGKNLSFQQVRIILELALDDYFNKKIDEEAISTLCTDLVDNIGYKESDFPPDLNITLQAGYELEWYSKNQKGNEETLNEWIEDLKSFYEENKHLIKN